MLLNKKKKKAVGQPRFPHLLPAPSSWWPDSPGRSVPPRASDQWRICVASPPLGSRPQTAAHRRAASVHPGPLDSSRWSRRSRSVIKCSPLNPGSSGPKKWLQMLECECRMQWMLKWLLYWYISSSLLKYCFGTLTNNKRHQSSQSQHSLRGQRSGVRCTQCVCSGLERRKWQGSTPIAIRAFSRVSGLTGCPASSPPSTRKPKPDFCLRRCTSMSWYSAPEATPPQTTLRSGCLELF